MEDPSPGSDASGSQVETVGRASSSRLARSGRFVAAHPVGIAQGAILALVVVVVLQNLEPTTLDFLFWSIAEVPKLVILIVAMLLGGALWEIARRLFFR
ncbi:MAG: hypothetical protein OEM05_06805 [Myxococcales bacterium]|nr:hypothetical protein [Myxococcales bacterium]